MSKYEPLRNYLQRRGSERVPMTFSEIEKLLGFKLPKSQMYPAWWSNNPTNNVMTNEWLAAGYRTEQVDIEGRKLVFRRTSRPDSPTPAETTGESGSSSKSTRRHPLIGFMKGMIKIAPGVDLTEPADPDWAEIAWGDVSKSSDQH